MLVHGMAGNKTVSQHTSYQWRGKPCYRYLANVTDILYVTSQGHGLCVHVWTLFRVKYGLSKTLRPIPHTHIVDFIIH